MITIEKRWPSEIEALHTMIDQQNAEALALRAENERLNFEKAELERQLALAEKELEYMRQHSGG